MRLTCMLLLMLNLSTMHQNHAYADTKALSTANPTPVSSSPKGAKIQITSPKDNAVVPSQFKLSLTSRMVTIMPAGIAHTDSGHYHILIDAEADLTLEPGQAPLAKSQVVFAQGEKEKIISLSPGPHTLQAVFVDHLHRVHQPPLMSQKIHLTVIAPIPNKKANKTTEK